MIHVEKLTRRYGQLTAVDQVDFRIDRGEVVGLLGHNGAGKTTIMKMLTGYLEPTAGTIRIDGMNMQHQRAAIQARIGYLPENCPVWSEMTVIDYLDFQAALHGVAPDQRAAAVARAIRRTDLKAKASARIDTLSRGYRQRVGVAQALLHRPDIIILDEPTNGLDPTQILQMRALIRDLAREATVIISTHILQEVQAVCERVLIMRAGKLVVDARLAELQKDQGLRLTTGEDASATLDRLPDITASREQADAAPPYRYRLDASPDQAPVIARALVEAGIPLQALEPRRQDLETLFAQVNEEVAHV